MKSKVWLIVCVVLLALAFFAKTGIAQERPNSKQTTTSAPIRQIFPSYFQFKGRYLAVLSDADMVASAYIDNNLGTRSPQMRDELSLIPLNNGLRELAPIRLPVSNAFTAWPLNLAGTFAMQNEARFARYEVTGNSIKLEAWGEPLITGKFPSVGHWTPDGSYFIVTNLYWFGGTADLYVGTGNSTLTVIAFNDKPRSGKVAHTIVSTASVGASAEEFTISPDGQRVVSLNMENSFLPPQDPRLTYYSSLTLLNFDRQTGILTPRGTYPFEGILPEGITFDASSQFLAVANFAHFNPQRTEQTTINFWRLVDSVEPKLVQLDVKVPVMRGAHIVKLIS